MFAHSEASVGNSFRYGYPSHPGLDTVYLPVHFSDAARDKLNEIVDAAKAQGRVFTLSPSGNLPVACYITPMTIPAVRISGLKKTYRDRQSKQQKTALEGIDLEIPRGSFFGLLGPNGAGKSTIINILAGMVVKSAGTVAIDGHDIDKARKKASLAIGVVPQELVLDTFFTVRQALDITAGYYGIPKEKRRTDEIISAMGAGRPRPTCPRAGYPVACGGGC